MNEQKTAHITIFQAPFASLMERGLYLKMYDPDYAFQEQVPMEYYLVAFDGNIECPKQLPEDKELRTYKLLEHVFSIFNTRHPAGYCGRSLSVGDVVRLEGKHYLCVTVGFKEVTFKASEPHPTANPTTCPLLLPNGTALQVVVYKATETTYPFFSIRLKMTSATLSPPMGPGTESASWSITRIRTRAMNCASVSTVLTEMIPSTMIASYKALEKLSSAILWNVVIPLTQPCRSADS